MDNLLTTVEMNLGKVQLESMAKADAEQLLEYEDALPVMVKIARASHYLAKMREALLDPALDELARHAEKRLSLDGAILSQAESGVSYDFSADQIWSKLKAEEGVKTDSRKSREKFLKALKEPLEEIDPDTKKPRRIVPPIRKSKTTLKVEL